MIENCKYQPANVTPAVLLKNWGILTNQFFRILSTATEKTNMKRIASRSLNFGLNFLKNL